MTEDINELDINIEVDAKAAAVEALEEILKRQGKEKKTEPTPEPISEPVQPVDDDLGDIAEGTPTGEELIEGGELELEDVTDIDDDIDIEEDIGVEEDQDIELVPPVIDIEVGFDEDDDDENLQALQELGERMKKSSDTVLREVIREEEEWDKFNERMYKLQTQALVEAIIPPEQPSEEERGETLREQLSQIRGDDDYELDFLREPTYNVEEELTELQQIHIRDFPELAIEKYKKMPAALKPPYITKYLQEMEAIEKEGGDIFGEADPDDISQFAFSVLPEIMRTELRGVEKAGLIPTGTQIKEILSDPERDIQDLLDPERTRVKLPTGGERYKDVVERITEASDEITEEGGELIISDFPKLLDEMTDLFRGLKKIKESVQSSEVIEEVTEAEEGTIESELEQYRQELEEEGLNPSYIDFVISRKKLELEKAETPEELVGEITPIDEMIEPAIISEDIDPNEIPIITTEESNIISDEAESLVGELQNAIETFKTSENTLQSITTELGAHNELLNGLTTAIVNKQLQELGK